MNLDFNTVNRVVFPTTPTHGDVSNLVSIGNAISRRIQIMEDIFAPCIIVTCTISTVAAGLFLGAPFFMAVAVIDVAVYALFKYQIFLRNDDLERINNVFKNRKPFTFVGYNTPMVVIESKSQGYPHYSLMESSKP